MVRAGSDARFRMSATLLVQAIFCALALLAATSCGKKSGTPDWDTPQISEVASPAALPAPEEATPEAAADEAPAEPAVTTPPAVAPPPAEPTTAGLRFITYNVENWLTMDRFVEGKTLKGAPKPDKEKNAVIGILTRNAPDVIGFCEIGTAADLAEIQEMLKAAGLDLPNSHYTGGSDLVRHLGLLSKFPIKSTAKPAETEYQLNGQTFGINRGILDASIDARGKSYRFVGVHLKSKRDSEQGDQEAIRLNEARLLRRHVDSIFTTDPEARLIVYGDFNETRSMAPIKTITGKYNDPTYLTAVPVKDSHQETWTHFWAINDVYSRFDFVMISKAMKKETDFKASRIIDDAEWIDASDHRPVMALFK